MQNNYILDKTFYRIDGSKIPLEKGDYENCKFNNCDFSNCDLSGYNFIDCTFDACNVSLVKLHKTGLRDIIFMNCKMLGLQFDRCNEFGLSFSFENCQLNHSSFLKTKIKKTRFKNTQLLETDFTDSDLTSALFDQCNFADAHFENTILEKADFTTSYNYTIDPEMNRLKSAKFSIEGIPGLLSKYQIKIER